MTVRVLFFGILKDITGMSEERLTLARDATVNGIFANYATRFPRLAEMSSSIAIAVNQEFAPRSKAVAENDEVAFLPPVSGGSGPAGDGPDPFSGGYEPFLRAITDPRGHFFALTRDAIDIARLRGKLLQGCDGAVVVFEGVTRNNTKGRRTLYLDYECYEAMAVEIMAQIGREIAASLEISRIALVHRLGRVLIGEASVVVMVLAPHRKAAFTAALEGINRLKKLVPIWKRERFEDGEEWVEGDWDPSIAGR